MLSVTGNANVGNIGAGIAVFTGNITGLNANLGNSVVANYFTGTFYGAANTAGTVTTSAQPNITSVGTLTTLNITGNVSSGGNIIGNGQYLTSLTGGNVTGTVSSATSATTAGTVTTAAQSRPLIEVNSTSFGDTTLSESQLLSKGYIQRKDTKITTIGNLAFQIKYPLDSRFYTSLSMGVTVKRI